MPYRKGCPYAVETFGRQEWRSPKSYCKMVNKIHVYMCEKNHQVLVIFLRSDGFLLILIHCCSLGPLVGKVKEYHIESIIDNLCQNMLSTNEQLRDISSIGKVSCYVIHCH